MAEVVTISEISLKKLAELIGSANYGSSRSLGNYSNTQRSADRSSSQDQKNSAKVLDSIKDQSKEFKEVVKAIKELKKKTDKSKEDDDQIKIFKEQLKSIRDNTKASIAIEKEQRKFRPDAETFKSHKNFNNATASLALVTAQLGDYVRTDWDAVNKLNFNMSKSLTSQTSLLNGMVEASGLENEAHDKYIAKLLNASRSLTSFGMAAEKAGVELHTAQDLSLIIHELSKEAGMMEKMMKELKDTGQPINEFVAGLHVMEQAGESLSKGQTEMLEAARKANLLDADGKVASTKAFEDHIKAVKRDIIEVQRTAQMEITKQKVIHQLKESLGGFGKAIDGNITSLGLLMAGIKLITSSFTGVWDQAKTFADSGFAYTDGFLQIQKSSVQLGLTVEQTAKIMQTNRQLLGNGTTDLNRFANALNVGQEGLREFGVVSNEEAASAVEGFIQNMAKGGIDIKNTESLNKSIEIQSKAFGKLKATTGASLAEFKQLNEEMMNSTAVQAELNGLSQTERSAKLEQNLKLRQSFVDMQMSAADANKAMLAMKDQGREKVATRFDQAAKLMQAANVAGLNNGKRLYDLYLKGGRRTADETEELVKGYQAITKQADIAGQSGNLQQEQVMQMMLEQVPGMQALAEVVRNASLKKDAAPEQKPEEILAQQISSDAAKGVSEISGALASLGAVLENPLVKMLAGITAVVVGMAGLAKLSVTRNRLLQQIERNTSGSTSGADDDSASTDNKRRRGSRTRTRKAGRPNRSKLGRIKAFAKGAGGRAGGLLKTGAKSLGRLATVASPVGIGLAALEGGSMMSDANTDMKAYRKALAEGGDISERNAWNDYGQIPGIGKFLTGTLGFHTALNEFDESGKRRQPVTVAPTSKSTATLGAPVPSGSPNVATSENELNAPVMKLSAETIASIVTPILQLLATENKSLNIEEQQLGMLMSLVESDAKAAEAAERLSHGETLSFADDWKKRNFIATSG
jgi:hypothetical protein